MILEFAKALGWPVASVAIVLTLRSIIKMVIARKAEVNFSFRDWVKFGAKAPEPPRQMEGTATPSLELKESAADPASTMVADERDSPPEVKPGGEGEGRSTSKDLFEATDEATLSHVFQDFKANSESYPNDPDFWETLYVSRRRKIGVGSYVHELQQLAAANANWIWPLIYQSQWHTELSDQEAAEDSLRQALARSSPTNRKWVLRTGIRLYFELVSFDRALEFLHKQLGHSLTDEETAGLFTVLAEECKKSGDRESFLITREIALVFAPEQHNERFSLAWEYGDNQRFPIPAYRHYLQLLRSCTDWPGPPNNLGVLVGGLSSELQIDNYERAIGLRNSLAASNLAHRLVDAGFISAAEAVLARFEDDEADRENFAEAKAKVLTARRELDKERSTLDAFVEAQYGRYRTAIMDAYRFLSRNGPNLEDGAFTSADKAVQVYISKDGAACRFPLGSVTLQGVLPRKALSFFGTLSHSSGGILDYVSADILMVPVDTETMRLIQWPSQFSRDAQLSVMELKRISLGPLLQSDTTPSLPAIAP